MTDFPLGQTIDHKFTTRAFATGTPTSLAGTPVLSIYEDNDTTEITAGITLTVDFDSLTGLNNVRVVATSGNGFESGKSYAVVITTGTVGGVSVVGEVVWPFTIDRSASAVDLANGTDGLGAIKTDTAAILIDTNELQSDDVPGLIAALNDFDPANDDVAVVTLVATTTVNTDMRGTDGANVVIPMTAGLSLAEHDATQSMIASLNDIAATDIVSTGAITTLGGAVANVTLVATVTLNSDMRGTDGGALASVATEARLSELDAGTAGKMANQVDLIKIETDSIDELAIKKNTVFSDFEFLMVLTSDGRTPATGLTVTGQRSIDGGAFASVSGVIAEVSNGIYQFDALAADTNGDVITWRFSAALADDTFLTFKTVT